MDTPDLPDDFLEINDEELDTAKLMALVRERVRQRRETLGRHRRAFPTFELIQFPGEPEGQPYDANLYFHLRVANEIYAQMETEPDLPPSPATRLPLIGKLWQRLRPALHVLVLIYVNRAAAQQVRVNRHLVSVLNKLTALTQEQQQALRVLQAEVAELRRERGA